jgi:hypothetical protein
MHLPQLGNPRDNRDALAPAATSASASSGDEDCPPLSDGAWAAGDLDSGVILVSAARLGRCVQRDDAASQVAPAHR